MSNINMTSEQLPWIIFELNDYYYAVNTRYVTGIVMMPSSIVPVPEAPEIFRGICEIRDEVVPLLDMRLLFGMQSVEQEYEEFKNMINQRKLEHENWIRELDRCLERNEPFRLQLDPCKCAFGQMLSSFKSHSNMINSHLKKIEGPHAELHNTGAKAIECEKRGEDYREQLEKIHTILAPRISTLLDETSDIFRHHYREMIITLSDNHKSLGIIVDEVVAVDSIEMVADKEKIHQLHRSPFVNGVAASPKIQGQIIVIDEEVLINERNIIGQEENSLSELSKHIETKE